MSAARSAVWRVLDSAERLPDIAYALFVLATSLGPVAVVGWAIFTVTGAL